MAEEEQQVEATEEEIKEASQMGWVDQASFKGAPENWVPAKEYLDKGRHVLPIVQATNERLRGQVSMHETRMASMEAALKAANTTIDALSEAHEADTKEQVEAARTALRKELAAATREGDHEAAAEITQKMVELKDAEETPAREEKVVPQKKELPPEIRQWFADNSDIRTNPRKLAMMDVVSMELRNKGETATGPAFLDKCADEVEKIFGGKRVPNRVEGDMGGGRRSNTDNGGGKTYADLPAEAKAACESQAKRLVGPTRVHKTVESWRKSYATQYFRSN